MDTKSILTSKLRRAILKRDKEVQKDMIILSKIMNMYDMGEYITIVENRILAEEVSDKFSEEHMMFDYIKGHIWLDAVALNYYNNILTGYIEKEKYNALLELVGNMEDLRRIQNFMIKLYRSKTIIGLFNAMKYNMKYYRILPDETMAVIKLCALELLSRTVIVKAFYGTYRLLNYVYAKYLSMKIKSLINPHIQQLRE